MLLNAKSEYACLAMLELAQQHASGQPVQVRTISERHGIPAPFLVQILQDFKRAGLVSSTRGASGGYRLNSAPEAVSLAEVLEIVEGPNQQTNCAAEASPLAPVLLDVCQELSAAHRERLMSLSLAELLDRATVEAGPMWYI